MDALIREARRQYEANPNIETMARLLSAYERAYEPVEASEVGVRPLEVSIGRNFVILDMSHARVLISYQTPVAAYVWTPNGPEMYSGPYHSRTTSKHIREFFGTRGPVIDCTLDFLRDLLRVSLGH